MENRPDLSSPAKVTEEFCLLSGEVNKQVFNYSVASDCFCRLNKVEISDGWRYEKDVFDFIKAAVDTAIALRHKTDIRKPGSPIARKNGCDCPYDQEPTWSVALSCPLHGFDGTHSAVRRR